MDKIDGALERIENRTYGICLGTGKPISKARLKARPWTRYCIRYAEMLEKGTVPPQVGLQEPGVKFDEIDEDYDESQE